MKTKGMIVRFVASCFALFLLALGPTARADDQTKANDLVRSSQQVFETMMNRPLDQRIPPELLTRAAGVAIFPSVARGGLIIGGQHGNGIVLRKEPGAGYSNPAFVSLSGGSFGAQAGGEEASIIMVLNSEQALNRFTQGVDLGTRVTTSAGPASGEAGEKADVYVYQYTKGAFAGVTLSGSKISADNDLTTAYYGRDTKAEQILQGTAKNLRTPPSAAKLKDTLAQYTAKMD